LGLKAAIAIELNLFVQAMLSAQRPEFISVGNAEKSASHPMLPKLLAPMNSSIDGDRASFTFASISRGV
jgi:hypothetical protein